MEGEGRAGGEGEGKGRGGCRCMVTHDWVIEHNTEHERFRMRNAKCRFLWSLSRHVHGFPLLSGFRRCKHPHSYLILYVFGEEQALLCNPIRTHNSQSRLRPTIALVSRSYRLYRSIRLCVSTQHFASAFRPFHRFFTLHLMPAVQPPRREQRRLRPPQPTPRRWTAVLGDAPKPSSSARPRSWPQ